MKRLELIKATIADYPVIQNMARFYAYDMSRDCGQQLEGWEFPENGLYECNDFKKYLEGNDNHAFLIKIGGELAGFVFVNKLEVMPEVDWNMGEFFIVAKFQRSGIGKTIAKLIFYQFPGEWSVGAIPQNRSALHFWRKVIAEYTHNNFYEVEKTSEQLKTAEYPEPYPMIMLRFKSPLNTFIVKDEVTQILNELSAAINAHYGYVTLEGSNYGEPVINSGPCGPFANVFFHEWNKRFSDKVSISFIMGTTDNDCHHVLIRLPNGLLYDGGVGVHDESAYDARFKIEDMTVYDYQLLDERSHGLNRAYPRFCPNFNLDELKAMIVNYLDKAKVYD